VRGAGFTWLAVCDGKEMPTHLCECPGLAGPVLKGVINGLRKEKN